MTMMTTTRTNELTQREKAYAIMLLRRVVPHGDEEARMLDRIMQRLTGG